MLRTYIAETDNRRKEIMWLALGLLAALAVALLLVVYVGYAFPGRSYDDVVTTFGLMALLGCAIAYFAGKEREQRQLNQSLVASLQDAVRELHARMACMDELTSANGEMSAALQGLRQELDDSYLRALRALMSTLDARDNYTALHGEQVTAIAITIARRMGLEEELVELIKRFGPLHDIGKIGIPDRVLHQAEPLAADDLAACLQHPAMGAAIISPLRPRAEALGIIRNHHERWDGGGYPDSLAGADIPLPARIMAVADAYHALISRRPYRPARGAAEAVRELMTNAGAQFDPDVAGVLAQLAAEGALHARGAG